MLDQQRDVINFLSQPSSYGLGEGAVERRETHASIVFLVHDRAYKLKRAVRYSYLDYATAERRRVMCEAELAINRRTAPYLYLDVIPIIRAGGTLRFGTREEAADALDWVLVMRRFNEDALLATMRRHGQLTPALMIELADAIASLHGDAEAMPRYGGAAGLARVIAENADIFHTMRDAPFAADRIAELCRRAQAAHARLWALLERRRTAGQVRRCHGDLHLNNICLIDGRPTLIDAIEFSEDLACIDVLYDLAFVLMDLDRHNLGSLANALFNRYLERTADYPGAAALPLFLSCRAAIRSHVEVSAARARAAPPPAVALRLFDHALSYLSPARPCLLAVGGVSGTGKSSLAAALAPRLGAAPGAVVLRSDVLRKRLMGVDYMATLPDAAYTTEVTEKIYAEITQHAAELLGGGRAVIADAVHGTIQERARIADVARQAGVPFIGMWLEAPLPVLVSRVENRAKEASDATVATLRKQLLSITAPSNWLRLEAAVGPAQLQAAAESSLAKLAF